MLKSVTSVASFPINFIVPPITKFVPVTLIVMLPPVSVSMSVISVEIIVGVVLK